MECVLEIAGFMFNLTERQRTIFRENPLNLLANLQVTEVCHHMLKMSPEWCEVFTRKRRVSRVYKDISKQTF